MARPRTIAPLAAVLLMLLTAAPAQAGTSYRVRWGDTLTWIAQDHRISLTRLASVNGLDPYGVLVEGTVLWIPHARHHAGQPKATHAKRRHTHTTSHAHRTRLGHYTVRWGDTLTGIAVQHGTSLLHLARLNGLDPYGILLSGATLRVPRHASSRPAEAETKPRARKRHHHTRPTVISASWTVQGSIDRWSAHYGVDRHLARAIAWMESGYHTGVVSSVGAWGVMQVMPDTWSYVETSLIGHRVQRTSDGNIRIGVAYIHHLLVVFHGNERLALAAYYQGPGAVETFGVLPVSRLYVADVLALKSRV
jgi:N-acetylmuramoyl-L-alanine amidase